MLRVDRRRHEPAHLPQGAGSDVVAYAGHEGFRLAAVHRKIEQALLGGHQQLPARSENGSTSPPAVTGCRNNDGVRGVRSGAVSPYPRTPRSRP